MSQKEKKIKRNYVGSETVSNGDHSPHQLRKRRHMGPKSRESPPPGRIKNQ